LLEGLANQRSTAMSNKSIATVATMDTDIGRNSFYVVGRDRRGAIVLRQKWSFASFCSRPRHVRLSSETHREGEPASQSHCNIIPRFGEFLARNA
jgi:hypothetical protein